MKAAAAAEEETQQPIDIQTLLHSLLQSTPHVQIFKGKWSIITNKLTTLQTRLSSDPDPLSSHSSTLITSLSATCSAAASLALLCRSSTPLAGKLKTQNDVDSISAKLDAHINDLNVLVTSGNFASSGGVSSSGSGTTRESIRVESRDLMTRLQIGSSESKNAALDLVLGLLQEDDKNVLIAVGQGLVPVLVRLLDSSSNSEIKEKAVTAIARISSVDSSKHVLLAEGLVLLNNLLRVLDSGSVFAKEKSCTALMALSNSKENARAIGSRGGVSSLLAICQQGTPNSQALAAGVLRNLAVFEDIKDCFVEDNAVLTLLGLCNSGTALAQENSLGCLCNLVCDDDDLKLFVAKEGGVECLKNFWDSCSSNESLEVVLQMVRILASCPNIAEFLVANGFLSRVAGVLSCGILGVRIAAAKALYDLAYDSKTRKELGELGCVSILVRMLDAKAVEEKESAAKALSMLMNYAGNRRIFRKEDKGIVSVVQLLDPLVQNLDKRYLVLVLSSLVHSKKCRKQMVAAGACVHLKKLMESEVEGAKKLYDSLGHGKLWGVFARH